MSVRPLPGAGPPSVHPHLWWKDALISPSCHYSQSATLTKDAINPEWKSEKKKKLVGMCNDFWLEGERGHKRFTRNADCSRENDPTQVILKNGTEQQSKGVHLHIYTMWLLLILWFRRQWKFCQLWRQLELGMTWTVLVCNLTRSDCCQSGKVPTLQMEVHDIDFFRQSSVARKKNTLAENLNKDD